MKEAVQMDKHELHEKLAEKVGKCWDSYVESLLKCSPSELISRAEEIAAANFCHDQLAHCASFYSGDLLEHLLRFNDPLETMRDQWIEEQNVDFSDEFSHALWSLREYGSEPDSDPTLGDMTMGGMTG